jgi:hypothetical protein
MKISDFSIEKYNQLCETVSKLPYKVFTVKQFIETVTLKERVIVLRHDVDRSFSHALQMAKLEKNYNIQASYYVRITPTLFKPEKIKHLKALNHEVGYHYEVLAKAGGNIEIALDLFEAELDRFRSIVAIDTISMHGSPLSRWNNLDIWQKISCEDYGLIGDASITIDYKNIYYFTDTGRSWNANAYNIRDRVASKTPMYPIHSTDDLIRFLKSMPNCPVFINTHPNRWSAGFFDYGLGLASDAAANWLKWLINKWHARRRFM